MKQVLRLGIIPAALGLDYGDFSFTNFTLQFNWYL